MINLFGGDFLQVVSALAVDHSGSRVLSGSYDYSVRMYDFGGMNSRLQSFRQLEPFEGHQVRNLSWSPTSDRFLCVTGSAQAKVLNADSSGTLQVLMLSFLKGMSKYSCLSLMASRFMTGMGSL